MKGGGGRVAELTPKQKRFVNEYLIDLNATQAAIRAGYSKKNAGKIGPELLGKTRIKVAIDKAIKAREERTKVTQDKVVKELAKLAFSNMKEFAVAIDKAIKAREERTKVTQDKVVKELAKLAFSNMKEFAAWGSDGIHFIESEELSDEAAACVAEIAQVDTKNGTNIKFKLHDKKGALELLGRHLGMFVDRHELTGKDGGPVQFGVVALPELEEE